MILIIRLKAIHCEIIILSVVFQDLISRSIQGKLIRMVIKTRINAFIKLKEKNMFSFFKPRWQHKDPLIRIEAINALLDNDELLLTIIRQDADTNVQLTALNKLTDISKIYGLYQSEPKQSLKQVILKHLLDLLAGIHPKAPDITTRLNYMSHVNYQKLPITYLIINTPDYLFAQKLLENVKHSQALFEIGSSQSLVKIDALQKIDDPSLLEQIIKDYKGNDKKILRQIKYHLNTLRILSEKNTIKNTLIEAFKKIATTEPLAPLNQFSLLENRWKQENFMPDPEKESASQRYLERLQEEQATQIEKRKQLIMQEEQKANALEAENQQKMQEKTEKEFQQSEKKIQSQKKNTEKSEHNKKQVLLDTAYISNLMNEIDTLLESGEKTSAVNTFKTMQEYLKSVNHTPLPATLNQKINFFKQKINKLNELETWASNQSREQLCLEAENLRHTNLPPDMLLDKLKALRAAWKILKGTEKLPPRALWKRFDSACKEIFLIVDTWRNAQANVRKNYLNEANQLLTDLNDMITQIDWNTPNWQHLDKVRSQFLSHWNQYLIQKDQYNNLIFSYRDQKNLENKMRSILNPLTEQLNQVRTNEALRRNQLILELEAKITTTPIDQLIDFTKKAQKAWAPLLPLSHKKEDVLWIQFKTLCDQIFEKRNENAIQTERILLDNLQNKQALISEMSQLLTELSPKPSDNPQMEDCINPLENKWNADDILQLCVEFETRWHNIGATPRQNTIALNEAFNTTLSKIKTKINQFNETIILAKQNFLQSVMTQLQSIEDVVVQGKFEEINHSAITQITANAEHLNANQKNAILQRIQTINEILEGQSVKIELLKTCISDNQHKARRLCILKEIKAGITSPVEDQTLRMNLQIELLNQTLSHSTKSQEPIEDQWETVVFGMVDETLMQRYFKLI